MQGRHIFNLMDRARRLHISPAEAHATENKAMKALRREWSKRRSELFEEG